MSKDKRPLPTTDSTSSDVSAFLDQARALQTRPDSRLLFAMDATASRQATWDRACALQARMFTATTAIAKLAVQLCYYRGIDGFRVLPWVSESTQLQQHMLNVKCQGGYTQIAKVLGHALAEHRRSPLQAVVFVGDAMEETPAALIDLAGQLRILGVPIFIFQEGYDTTAGRTFSEIARISNGVHFQFDEHSERQLRELLTAVAVYASGGVDAVKKLSHSSPVARDMIKRLPGY